MGILTSTLDQRIDQAQAAIETLRFSQLLEHLPNDEKSYNKLAQALAKETGETLNSAHISKLVVHGYLSRKLERILITMGELEPHQDPVLVDPCPDCGHVHAVKWCTFKNGRPVMPKPAGKKRVRRARFSAAADDAQEALTQIEKYYPGMFTLNGDNNER